MRKTFSFLFVPMGITQQHNTSEQVISTYEHEQNLNHFAAPHLLQTMRKFFLFVEIRSLKYNINVWRYDGGEWPL